MCAILCPKFGLSWGAVISIYNRSNEPALYRLRCWHGTDLPTKEGRCIEGDPRKNAIGDWCRLEKKGTVDIGYFPPRSSDRVFSNCSEDGRDGNIGRIEFPNGFMYQIHRDQNGIINNVNFFLKNRKVYALDPDVFPPSPDNNRELGSYK